VSDGAMSFYHDRFVHTRISKFTYGTFWDPPFDPADPDHQQRFDKVYADGLGRMLVEDSFDVILPKVCLFSFAIVFVIVRC
jgi:hypothetical protein